MIIEKGFGNNYYGNLVIENYPNLQSIIVYEGSLRNVNSLKICNCDKLKSIEACGDWDQGAFDSVEILVIESIPDNDVDVYIFLNYNHS